MSSLLIVGASKAGKTVYGAQFYLRTQAGAYLSSAGEADDLTIFYKAIEAISQGLKPERTKEDESRTLALTVRNQDGQQMEVLWPDYAGESFADLIKRRVFTEEWVTRVTDAAGMILMIRSEGTPMPTDALQGKALGQNTRLNASPPAYSEAPPEELVPLFPDAQYVEWLQMMRHLRGEGRLQQSRWPLVVILSCWDELKDPKSPAEELQRTFPLLASYLRGIWVPQAMQIYGLSALGQAFKEGKKEVTTSFLEKRPEEQGYVICPSGEETPDLTLPIAWILDRLHADQG